MWPFAEDVSRSLVYTSGFPPCLAVRKNLLKNFAKLLLPGPTPRDFDLMGLKWSQTFVWKLPRWSPELRPTRLGGLWPSLLAAGIWLYLLAWLLGTTKSLHQKSLWMAGKESALSLLRKCWSILNSWVRWWWSLTLSVIGPANILSEAPGPSHKDYLLFFSGKGSHLLSRLG